jgi:hypothetical protein
LSFGACKPSIPSDFIQPDELEDILYDYHLAMTLAQDSSAVGQELSMQSVLKKHGVTQEKFDTSLVYYYRRIEHLQPIYSAVAKRLDAQAVALGASVGALNAVETYSADGDTSNVWTGPAEAVLIPYPIFNRLDISQTVDSTYLPGDKFLLRFGSLFLQPSNVGRNAVVYLSVAYRLNKPEPHDTLVNRYLHINVNANNHQVSVEPPAKDAIPTSIRGYFYLSRSQDSGKGKQKTPANNTTATRLLFLNNILLIRYHEKHEEPLPTDSLTSAAPPDGATAPDSLSGGDGKQPLDSVSEAHT